MTNIIRFKRRVSGSADAPTSLENGEVAFNEVSEVLYYGKGTSGAGGTATAIIAIAGTGAFMALSGNQTVAGTKTFSSQPIIPDGSAANHAASKGQVDSLLQGKVSLTGAETIAGTKTFSSSPVVPQGSLAGHAVNVQQLNDAIAGAGGGDMMKATYDPQNKNANAFNVDNHSSGTVNKIFTAGEQLKLSGIQANATANDTDANLRNRANHTGSQAIGTVTGLQTALNDKVDASTRGQANGVATLDGAGKVPTAQLPDSVLGAMVFIDFWNAATNTPTIPAAAAGNKGHYYIVQVAGSSTVGGISEWAVGDWVVSNGTVWSKIDNTDAVTSVNGQTGPVVIDVDHLASAGSMANQNANNVAITGGTIDNINLDGGTF